MSQRARMVQLLLPTETRRRNRIPVVLVASTVALTAITASALLAWQGGLL